MLNTKQPKNSNDLSVVGQTMNITGNITMASDIDILGSFNGDGEFDCINIRESGSVKGNISANKISIAGKFEGKINTKKIIVSKTGSLTGEIFYESIIIEDGAILNCELKRTI